MVVETVAPETPRREPVEPECLDQGRPGGEQLAPRTALIAAIGIAHAASEHPVAAEGAGFGEQGGNRARFQTTIRIQK